MLKFECPNCKFIADETELSPGGEAHISRESCLLYTSDAADE